MHDTQEMNQIRIEYDDDQLNVLDKINAALKPHGFSFVDDDLPHDGYCLFTLQTVAKADAYTGTAEELRIAELRGALAEALDIADRNVFVPDPSPPTSRSATVTIDSGTPYREKARIAELRKLVLP